MLGKDYSVFAWAVHLSDVSAIPVPATVWLFGSGLLGLIGISRRKKTT
ncbi:MAG: PEP-CTERM sorting domain-containing protein [Gammaproteobacteria bacterium]